MCAECSHAPPTGERRRGGHDEPDREEMIMTTAARKEENKARTSFTVRLSGGKRMTYILRPRRIISRLTALLLTLVGALPGPAAALDSNALPTGGSVSSGSASISTSSNNKSMTVTQGSAKVIVDWGTFNIGKNASVTFDQPNRSSIALNRVATGSSEIAGSLQANGQIFLVNPNGILFSSTARVDVGGMVASTLAISNDDFNSGKYVVSSPGAGAIVNDGSISADKYVVLLAPHVANTGTIKTANYGSVAIGSGDKATVTLGGSDLIGLSVDQATLKAVIENSGTISANGGSVLLSAKGADALASAVVNNAGLIEATSVSSHDGIVRLEAVGSGSTITFSNSNANGQGGSQNGHGHDDNLGGRVVAGSVRASAANLVFETDTSIIATGHSGDTIVLNATDAFTNRSGAGLLNVDAQHGARWLVYSHDPAADTKGGLVAAFKRYDCTYGGACPAFPAAGNGFLYSIAPVLYVTPGSGSGTYGNGHDLTGTTYSVAGSGLIDGDTLGTAGISGTAGFAFADPSVNSHSDKGSYDVQYTNGLLSTLGYRLADNASSTGEYTINARAITLSAPGGVAKTYDGTATAHGNVVIGGNGLADGDSLLTGLAYDNKNAGSNKTVSVTSAAMSYGGTDKTGNYDISYGSASDGIINKADLTIAAVADSKTYDGTRASAGVVGITGLVAGDTLSATQTFDSKNAGSRTLAVANYTLRYGNHGVNYNVATTTAAGSITPADLTIAAVSDTKTYDGTRASTGVVGITGLVGGDTLVATQTFDSKNAGSRTLAVANYTLHDGNHGGNYNVSTTTAEGSITPADLTIAAVADTKTYDGTRASTGVVGITGLVAGDTLVATQTFDSKNAGSRTLAVANYTLHDGNHGGNYNVSTTTAEGSIAQADLTIAAVSDAKTYDGTRSSAQSVAVTGLVGGDTLVATQTFDSKNAGSRTLAVSGYSLVDGNGGGNYNVTTSTADGTISPATLAVIGKSNVDKTYDATTALPASAGSGYSVAGILGDDQVAVAANAAYDSALTGHRVVVIDGAAKSGIDAGNYVLAVSNGSGTILPAVPTSTGISTGTSTGVQTAAPTSSDLSAGTQTVVPTLANVADLVKVAPTLPNAADFINALPATAAGGNSPGDADECTGTEELSPLVTIVRCGLGLPPKEISRR
jgi:filamentous hemagglutinin family protein